MSPLLAGLAAAAIMAGVGLIVAGICGTQYAQFNPSE
jgi:hypothetical protein